MLRFLPVVASVAALSPPSGAQLVEKQELSASLRLGLADAALQACANRGIAIAVAVTDSVGTVRTLISADGVPAFAIETAAGKAYTAATLQTDTAVLVGATKEAPDFAAVMARHSPALTLLGGGVALRHGGAFLGAIGVGGADRPEKDEACAQVAVADLAARLR